MCFFMLNQHDIYGFITGSLFDETGNMKSIWDSTTRTRFDQRGTVLCPNSTTNTVILAFCVSYDILLTLTISYTNTIEQDKNIYIID